MKQYPTISSKVDFGANVVGFDKLDGSNVRAEWNRRKGFYKFGRRHGLLDHTSPLLTKEVPGAIMERYGDPLDRIFRQLKVESTVAFFEFFGASSFAGMHKEDEPHEVVLFDVSLYRKGMMGPERFIDTFGPHVRIPTVVFQGEYTPEVEEGIRTGTLPGITFEGVVCKSNDLTFKVKTDRWKAALREFTKGDETLFARML